MKVKKKMSDFGSKVQKRITFPCFSVFTVFSPGAVVANIFRFLIFEKIPIL